MNQLSSTTTPVIVPTVLLKATLQQVARFSLLLLFLSTITFLYWILYKSPQAGIDDSDIYFTYVKNFVNGHGFVFYQGGERVEGFTSLLWVLLCSVFYWMTPQSYPQLILGFNVILITWALFMCCNFIRTLTKSEQLITPAEILFLAVLCLVPGYVDWTILTLMETGLWSFLLIVTTISICRLDTASSRGLTLPSTLVAMLIFVRPESYLWSFGFVFLMFLKFYLRTGTLREAFGRIKLPLVLVLLSIASLTLFRLVYFGYPLPNTYYAKVSSDMIYNLIEGVRYYIHGAIQSPVLILIALVSVVSWIASATLLYRDHQNQSDIKDSTWVQFALASVAIVSLALPAYTGGDHFKLVRFYQPFFPVYLLMFINVAFWAHFVNIKIAVPSGWRYATTIAVVPFIYLCTHTPLHTYVKGMSPLDWEFRLSELGRQDARKMNTMFGRMATLPSVGVCTAGGFGYAYSGPVIDLMGLNSVKMAHASDIRVGFKNHAAFDINTFYDLAPDIFHGYFRLSSFVDSIEGNSLYENDPAFEGSFTARLYKGMLKEPRFKELYKPVLIQDPETKFILKTYVRSDFIPRLLANDYAVHENFWTMPNTSTMPVVLSGGPHVNGESR